MARGKLIELSKLYTTMEPMGLTSKVIFGSNQLLGYLTEISLRTKYRFFPLAWFTSTIKDHLSFYI